MGADTTEQRLVDREEARKVAKEIAKDEKERRKKSRRFDLAAQDRFIERVREVAHDCGYAVGVHGSRQRDLDLIAVPWTHYAINPYKLVDAVCERCDLIVKPYEDRLMSNPERKPNGRIAWSLCGAPECEYVDLSVFA